MDYKPKLASKQDLDDSLDEDIDDLTDQFTNNNQDKKKEEPKQPTKVMNIQINDQKPDNNEESDSDELERDPQDDTDWLRQSMRQSIDDWKTLLKNRTGKGSGGATTNITKPNVNQNRSKYDVNNPNRQHKANLKTNNSKKEAQHMDLQVKQPKIKDQLGNEVSSHKGVYHNKHQQNNQSKKKINYMEVLDDATPEKQSNFKTFNTFWVQRNEYLRLTRI